MPKKLKHGLLLYLVTIMIIFAGCEKKVELDSLRTQDFEKIEMECLGKIKGYMGHFNNTLAKTYFINPDSYEEKDYAVEEINLMNRVYSFNNEDGEYCLAIMFEAVIGRGDAKEKANIWNYLVLVNPVWVEDEFSVLRYELWADPHKGWYETKMTSSFHSSGQEALEWMFNYKNPNAQMYEYKQK